MIVLPGLLGSSFFSMLADRPGRLGALGVGIAGSLIVYVLGIVAAGLSGGISWAITALVYNAVASIAGGIEVQLEE